MCVQSVWMNLHAVSSLGAEVCCSYVKRVGQSHMVYVR